jgi:uncharacterized protein
MLPRTLPPFTWKTAIERVRTIEDSWNTRDPVQVALSYSIGSFWRIRLECLSGRAAIEAFLARKWAKERECRLMRELWAFTGNRLAARFACEYHDESQNWFRTYGSESLEFDQDGLIVRCITCADEHPIGQTDRAFLWPQGRRPDDHPELSDFDF